MATKLLLWSVYDIRSDSTSLIGISLRGRIRKYGVQNSINVLVENASDADNCVRFALLTTEDDTQISEYILSVVPDATIAQSLTDIPNPVLSKLSIVTNEAKYEIR